MYTHIHTRTHMYIYIYIWLSYYRYRPLITPCVCVYICMGNEISQIENIICWFQVSLCSLRFILLFDTCVIAQSVLWLICGIGPEESVIGYRGVNRYFALLHSVLCLQGDGDSRTTRRHIYLEAVPFIYVYFKVLWWIRNQNPKKWKTIMCFGPPLCFPKPLSKDISGRLLCSVW